MPRANLSRKTILTVSEVSQYLRLHRSTVYRMLKKNQLPAFRVRCDSRFTVEDLDNRLR
jgi:excisionase family DNA binding protein